MLNFFLNSIHGFSLVWKEKFFEGDMRRSREDLKYCKISKISPRAYIFQRPFLRGLFLEGLIFRGAYLRREICVSKSIGLALKLEGNLPFLLCFTLYLRTIFKYKPPRGLYLQGWFYTGLFALWAWGAYIWRGLYMDGLIFRILR